MDIATITDVLDYVRKCSKLVNAFIIGIIRQTQADDLTKPIENVENYDFSIDGHIDLRLKALNIIKLISDDKREKVANLIFENYNACINYEVNEYVHQLRADKKEIFWRERLRDTYPAIFDSVFSALVFIYKIHDVITEWVCDGVECCQIGNMSSLLSGVGFKCKNPYVVKSEKLLMAPKNSYYLSNSKGIKDIYLWLIELVDFVAYDGILEGSNIPDDIDRHMYGLGRRGHIYGEEYIMATNAILTRMDQAAREAVICTLIQYGWRIFGTDDRLKHYINHEKRIAEQSENFNNISSEENYFWEAISALATFYSGIAEVCIKYKISDIKNDKNLQRFCHAIFSWGKDAGDEVPETPIKRGRRSCREMALKDYFTLDADIEIERIVETIAIKSGIPRSKIVAEEIMRLKEEGKIIELNGRLSGFINQLRGIIPDLPTRQSICQYLPPM